MATIADIKRRVDVFKFNDAAEQAFISVEDDFTEENKKQLFGGYDKFQERLRHYANAEYAFYKYSKNPAPGLGNPDLFDTGSFYNHIQTIVRSGTISIGSTDSKAPELEVKYPGIFGLGGKYKAEFIEQNLRPAWMRQVKKELQL
jgi:hypothetical protein